MNDDTTMNVWQDRAVAEQQSGPTRDAGADRPATGEPAPSPADQAAITTVEQLKALADPIRLTIIGTLMQDTEDLPVMSVKELAQALSEPQTKLYRHVRQLEAAGLIRVAATRMVSGIAEQRYQASQRNLDMSPALIRQHADEAEAVMKAVFDQFRAGFLKAYQADPAVAERAPLTGNTAIVTAYRRLSRSEDSAVRAKLREALAYFHGPDSTDRDAVQMNLLVGFYLPDGESQA